ncbi:hypothetical protein Y032_0066g3758 [Ancylostoma ceylanicum]|nr:hypothetical protein Y032_0066g3758 [Ancylostoma ceylanicum]
MSGDAGSSVAQFFSTHTPADHPKDEPDVSSDKLTDLIKNFNDDQLKEFFHLDETVTWIRNNGYKRVALQLPDHFLSRAYCIAKFIELSADVKTFLLADTSYRSCCVDEVAAAHASCDAIVHYGDACLSALTENIPVKFVFGSFPVDLSTFGEVKSYINLSDDTSVLLLTDACYSENLVKLAETIEQSLRPSRLFRAVVVDPSHKDALPDNPDCVLTLGRLVPQEFCHASSVQVCFVGDPASPLLPLWLMTYPHCTSLLVFDPQTSTFEERQ